MISTDSYIFQDMIHLPITYTFQSPQLTFGHFRVSESTNLGIYGLLRVRQTVP